MAAPIENRRSRGTSSISIIRGVPSAGCFCKRGCGMIPPYISATSIFSPSHVRAISDCVPFLIPSIPEGKLAPVNACSLSPNDNLAIASKRHLLRPHRSKMRYRFGDSVALHSCRGTTRCRTANRIQQFVDHCPRPCNGQVTVTQGSANRKRSAQPDIAHETTE
jgi:hypothetical protein